jgi:hypothetical protein
MEPAQRSLIDALNLEGLPRDLAFRLAFRSHPAEPPSIDWLTLLRPVSAGEIDQILSYTSKRLLAAEDLKLSARLWKEMED